MTTPATQCIVVANGVLADIEATQQRSTRWLERDAHTLIIAANGGTHNALTLGITPAIVVGDLDSLSKATQEQLAAEGCQFQISPARKDQTDLELALRYAVQQQVRQIWILGALGGRLDQTMSNILLMTLPVLDGIAVHIVEGAQTAWLVHKQSAIRGAAGDTFSLIALGGNAHGVTTEGLEYALVEATLPFGPSLGISNVLLGEHAAVSVREGTLLAMHKAREI